MWIVGQIDFFHLFSNFRENMKLVFVFQEKTFTCNLGSSCVTLHIRSLWQDTCISNSPNSNIFLWKIPYHNLYIKMLGNYLPEVKRIWRKIPPPLLIQMVSKKNVVITTDQSNMLWPEVIFQGIKKSACSYALLALMSDYKSFYFVWSKTGNRQNNFECKHGKERGGGGS